MTGVASLLIVLLPWKAQMSLAGTTTITNPRGINNPSLTLKAAPTAFLLLQQLEIGNLTCQGLGQTVLALPSLLSVGWSASDLECWGKNISVLPTCLSSPWAG